MMVGRRGTTGGEAACGKAEGASIKDWTRGVDVELSPEFSQLNREATARAAATAKNAADALTRMRQTIDDLNKSVEGLITPVDQLDISPPPTTGRFENLDIPTVQELNTDPPHTP